MLTCCHKNRNTNIIDGLVGLAAMQRVSKQLETSEMSEVFGSGIFLIKVF